MPHFQLETPVPCCMGRQMPPGLRLQEHGFTTQGLNMKVGCLLKAIWIYHARMSLVGGFNGAAGPKPRGWAFVCVCIHLSRQVSEMYTVL